jgi:YHS domain-containing protein
MTAARQERKPRRFLGAGAALLAVVSAWWVAQAVHRARAATTELVVVNRHTGLAIDGVDPVSYFVDSAPKIGNPALEHRYAGASWRFSNEGNRSAFAADPEVYAPRFGGHDAIGVARGAAAPGHPDLWLIVSGRLYLFHSAPSRAAFAVNPDRAIGNAMSRWPQVRRTLAR